MSTCGMEYIKIARQQQQPLRLQQQQQQIFSRHWSGIEKHDQRVSVTAKTRKSMCVDNKATVPSVVQPVAVELWQ